MTNNHRDSELVYNVGDLVGDPLYPVDTCNIGIITRVVETLCTVKYEVAWQKPSSRPFYNTKLWDHYEIAIIQRLGVENE